MYMYTAYIYSFPDMDTGALSTNHAWLETWSQRMMSSGSTSLPRTLKIAAYTLSPETLPEEVSHLKVILAEHHATFVTLYPNASFIPKMHYLLHIPRLMLKYVSLIWHYSVGVRSL